MISLVRSTFLQIQNLIYQSSRPLTLLQDAQTAHETLLDLLAKLDGDDRIQNVAKAVNALSFPDEPITIGNAELPHPMILAAGFVKGHGFETEEEAMNAVEDGRNIIPGWRTIPSLVGPVEFGSFTRWPRLGNSGTVIWRDPDTYSTQNRIGLKNPGVMAASEFLSQRAEYLPKTFGINIAVTPGLDEVKQEAQEIQESLESFLSKGIRPAWFTLNISCPNTEDDPGNHQTQEQTEQLCATALNVLSQESPARIPLWVKISPGLATDQYTALAEVFNELDIPAVITTNTLGRPAPGSPELNAGVGGGRLHQYAVDAAHQLKSGGYTGDIVGCGGIIDPIAVHQFKQAGASAFQYWSALVYRGPLAAALILNEVT